MSDLFKASAPTGQTIAGYRVALGAVARGLGGDLRLNGEPVADGRTSFIGRRVRTSDLHHRALTSQQSLVVVAQTGTRLPDGTG